MEYLDLLFYGLIFITAFLYSTVGHGGASGYLALMAIFAFAPETMKATALIMNLFVAGIAFLVNLKSGNFKLPLLLPFAIASIPMAFIGAKVDLDPHVYKIILGVFLFIISFRFIFFKPSDFDVVKTPHWGVLMLIGAALGYVSGMIGIGGGVILSPIILIFHWAKLKQASAVAAAFIFLNSVSGIWGLYSNGYKASDNLWILVSIGVFGALLGAYSSTQKFTTKTIQYILTVVLFSAGIKLALFS